MSFNFSKEEISKTLKVLNEGGLILYPTDTIWGIGCDATNSDAVKKIYDLKKRMDSKSMLVLVDNDETLNRYVDDIPEVAFELIEAADRPLTIIYDHPVGVAPNLLAEDGSLGIRITEDPFCRELCRRLRKPLVSTSANISGQKSPSNFSQISEEIKKGVDYVVEYRQNEQSASKPSNIIKLSDGGVIKIIR